MKPQKKTKKQTEMVMTESVKKQRKSRKGGPKLSAAKIARIIRKVLGDQYNAFLAKLPSEVVLAAVATGKTDQAVGEYILGDQLQAYLTAPVWRRKKIALRAIRACFERVGFELPSEFQIAVSVRGPRDSSKITQLQALLTQTEGFLATAELEQLHPYFANIQSVLAAEIKRLTKIYEYVKRYQAKRQTETAEVTQTA